MTTPSFNQGELLMLWLANCQNTGSLKETVHAERFILELCGKLGFKPAGSPHSTHFYPGFFSSYMQTTQGQLTLHGRAENKTAVVHIFSHTPFDTGQAHRFVRQYLSGDLVHAEHLGGMPEGFFPWKTEAETPT